MDKPAADTNERNYRKELGTFVANDRALGYGGLLLDQLPDIRHADDLIATANAGARAFVHALASKTFVMRDADRNDLLGIADFYIELGNLIGEWARRDAA